MSSSTCRGPQCTFLGGRNDSKAKKGRCTNTAGYISDFEINEIITKGGAIKKWYDEATDSDYLVYDGDEWVAYMSKVTKSRRMRDYMKLNFGGTTDWAIDLQGDHDKRYTSGRPVFLDPKVWETPSATCEAPCILVFPPSKLPEATTIKLNKYTTSLEYGANGKTTISGKETTAFVTKTTTITADVPMFVTSSMMYSNVNITQGQRPTDLVVRPSIKLPHIPVQVPDGEGGTTTRTLTLPPWPFSAQNTGGSSNHSQPSRTSTFDWGEVETPQPPWIDAEETPDETISGLPVYTQWPPEFRIEPIKEEIKEPTPDDDGFKTPCELWFFQLCFPGFKSLKWKISPGILPPGPPPPSFLKNLPVPGIIHPPRYPPWPRITVGLDRKPTYSPKPECETDSASLCWTTTTLSPTVIGPVTSTVTNSDTDCKTIYGCSLTDWETELTKAKPCTRPTAAPKRHLIRDLAKRKGPVPHTGCYEDTVVIPYDLHQDGTSLSSMLDSDGIAYKTVITRDADDTKDLYVYWWIPNMSEATRHMINSELHGIFEIFKISRPSEEQTPGEAKSRNIKNDKSLLSARQGGQDLTVPRRSKSWAPSQITLPKDKTWKDPNGIEYDPFQTDPYLISSESELGSGQFVYVVGEEDINTDHEEFRGADIEYLDVPIYHELPEKGTLDAVHGSAVAAMVVGRTMGMSPKSTLVMANIPWHERRARPMLLSAWAATLNDIVKQKRRGNAVVSSSVVFSKGTDVAYLRILYQIIIELGKTQTVVVTGAGNGGTEEDPSTIIDEWPPSFGADSGPVGGPPAIDDLIVVGATNERGWKSPISKGNFFMDIIYAPGDGVLIPDGSGTATKTKSGTSFSAPLVAGLAAYFRSLPSKSYQEQLRQPATVKRLIKALSRQFAFWDEKSNSVEEVNDVVEYVVWNGHSGGESCLMGKSPPPDGCPELPPDLSKLPDSPSSPGGSPKRITWESGPDGPKCSANSIVRRLFERAEATCGGQLCSGYYCRPNPPGPPPDFRDPKDPNRNGNDPQGGVKPPTSTTTTTTTTTSKPEPTGGSGSPDDNFGLRFMDKNCGESVAEDVYGRTEKQCTSVTSTSVYKVDGFTRNSYKACFYYNDDCQASSSSDYSMLSGGSGIPSSGGCVGFSNKAIKAYRVTTGDCSGDAEEAWDLTFSKDCKGSLGKASGYGKTACSNNIPKGANSVNGNIPSMKRNWKACLYIHEDCKTTEVPPGNEVFALWDGDGCESFKSKKKFSSFLVTNGVMCP